MSDSNIPSKVVEAFDHVRSIHHQVMRVVYLPDGTWLYLDVEGEAPSFEGKEINLDLLGEASDQCYEHLARSEWHPTELNNGATSFVMTEQGLREDRCYIRGAFEKAAREKHHRDGECEIDEGAEVSFSDDFVVAGGAYVKAWVWVDNPFAK